MLLQTIQTMELGGDLVRHEPSISLYICFLLCSVLEATVDDKYEYVEYLAAMLFVYISVMENCLVSRNFLFHCNEQVLLLLSILIQTKLILLTENQLS